MMRTKFLASLLPAAGLAVAILLAPQPSAGQAAKAAPKAAAKANTYKAPRTPDGHADLQGVWQVLDTSIAAGIEPHTPALGIQAGVGVIVDPADGKIPYKPEARAKQQENFKNRAKLDPVNKCYMPGPSRVLYMPFPFQILQTPVNVAILSEFGHSTRNMFMQGKHLDGLELWMGDSRAKWEGDTLVVDVTQMNPQTWLDASGNHFSADAHLVERFTRTGADTLQYEATYDDPKTYTRPWTMRVTLHRRTEPNVRVLEYDCNAYMEFEGGK
ncbi:MAG: hypothetical protein RL328_231 [Acidobacteriota bacterium]